MTDTNRTTDHVPGPWLVGASEHVQRVEIYREHPDGIIDPIGCAYGSCGENIANARLIAAAPDLLAELKALRTLINRADIVEGHRRKCLRFQGADCDCRVGIAMERIEKLIDKAEGRS